MFPKGIISLYTFVSAEIQHLKPGSSSLMYNTQIIEDAALAHMRRETSFDLSSMNF